MICLLCAYYAGIPAAECASVPPVERFPKPLPQDEVKLANSRASGGISVGRHSRNRQTEVMPRNSLTHADPWQWRSEDVAGSAYLPRTTTQAAPLAA